VLANARVNWAAPSAIGGTTPAAITGTAITANTKFVGSRIEPASDSTTAIIVGKAAGGASVVTLDSTNSRVGINVTPSGSLDVKSTGTAYTDKVVRATDSASVGLFSVTGDGRVYVGADTGVGNKLVVTKAVGDATGNNLASFKDNSVSGTPELNILAGASNIQLELSGSTGKMFFGNLGRDSQALTLDTATGNVGVGMPSPGKTLDVNGTLRIAGIFTIPGWWISSDGSAGGIYLDTLNNLKGSGALLMTSSAASSLGGSLGLGGITPTARLHVLASDATAGITNVAILDHVLASGGASAGFGPGLLLRGTSSQAGTTREMGYMYSAWTTATDLSRASKVVIGAYNVGTAVDVLTIPAINGLLLSQPTSGSANFFYAGSATIASATDNSLGLMAAGLGSSQDNSIGPYLGARGNLYTGVATQRGNIFIAAGYPTTPLAGEGQIRFIAGTPEAIRMVVDKTGFVGIGTSSPGAALQVNAAASGVGFIVRANATTPGDIQQWQDSTPTTLAKITSAGVLALSTIAPLADSTTALKLTKADGTTAVVTVDTTNSQVILGAGTATNPSLMFTGVSNTGIYFASSKVTISASGVGVVQFSRPSGSTGVISNPASASTAHLQLQSGSSAVTVLTLSGDSTAANITLGATDAATATVTDVLIIDHSTSGSPVVAPYGTGLRFRGQDSTTPSQEMGRVRTAWTDPTHLTRASKMVLSTYAVGTEVDAVTILSDGSVGIGASPSAFVDVQKSQNATTQLRVKNGTNGTAALASFSLENATGNALTALVTDSNYTGVWGAGADAVIAAANFTNFILANYTASGIIQFQTGGIGNVRASIPAAGGVRVHSDPGSGAASTTTLTNATGTPSNTATPAGYAKLYIGTTTAYVPYYT
jgi:hypothetical protein